MSINRETLDAVFAALDASTTGPWKKVGSTHCNGVGGDFDSMAGAFKLVCGEASGANCDAIVAAVNWLRDNRDALTSQPVAPKPVAWITTVACIGPDYGKEIYGKLPVQSLQAGYYRHTPLYAASAVEVKS